MRAVFRFTTLGAATVLLGGCWLFEDTPTPSFSHPATIPSQPPSAPTENAQAGHASPVTPARDQRPRALAPTMADMARDLLPRVSIATPGQNTGNRTSDITAEERLTNIATDDRDFFQELYNENSTWTEVERNRRAQALNNRYADYLTEHPDDIEALILYGKFLRKVGERELAFEVFLSAREHDPKIAVVHQQLGNFLAEEGKYAGALDAMRKAVNLAPQEALYHYQLGELLSIYYDSFIAEKTFTPAELNQAIAGEFARAAELAPQEPGFAWRRAECYYDMREPDWAAALAAWEALASKSTSPVELEIIRLHRARVLLELGRREDARVLIRQPVRRSLEATRAQLAQRLDTPPAPAALPGPAVAPGS